MATRQRDDKVVAEGPIDDVEAGPSLRRVLRLTETSNHAGSAARALVAVAFVVGATAVSFAAIAASLLTIGEFTDWLHRHVSPFASRPRLAAVAAWLLATALFGTTVFGFRIVRRRRSSGR